ncbi:unnamed protein product [Gongylonema pulchrum]|uniref:dolichyl-diphosphooligosaccharide--protein glycotransferase n=1 Tax=Gongylonema pulchrum TaxID=637853 RepID=A0A183DQP0_9BILA|nr:unnamed protein product [Gongylonema pulchrum]
MDAGGVIAVLFWFNYRATRYMVEQGYYNFLNWFDERAWYPLGRIVGGTVYPGLMVTSGLIHYTLSVLNIPVHIRDICKQADWLPVIGLTAIATYLLTKELWSPGAGLFAACFIAISPGYTSRSVAGSYDNEGIAIFALQFTYFLWVRSVKTGSVFWATLTALSYFYMVSAWGGYVFIINLIPLHVLTLILIGRYCAKLYIGMADSGAVSTSSSSSKMLAANSLGITSLLTFVILVLAWLVGFASRLFAIVRFESIIHEFDPWQRKKKISFVSAFSSYCYRFNYRATRYMVEQGYYNFLNWFDERAWYPLGRIVGGTVYPGLMVTSGLIHYTLSVLNIPVHIRDICFTYFLWVRSVKTGSVFWATLTALSYFYMVSAWGGYVFIINLIPLHVLTLILIGRYCAKLYIAYTTFYVLGQIMAMQVPFVGFQPVKTSEHMAAAGVFGLLQVIAALKYAQRRISRKQFITLFFAGVSLAFMLGLAAIVLLTYAG